jgi:hypothetical protein
VHIFRIGLDRPAEEVESEAPDTGQSRPEAFWAELRRYDAFESTKRLPQLGITKDGHYALVPDKPKNGKVPPRP